MASFNFNGFSTIGFGTRIALGIQCVCVHIGINTTYRRYASCFVKRIERRKQNYRRTPKPKKIRPTKKENTTPNIIPKLK